MVLLPSSSCMKAKKRVRRAGLVELGRGSGMYATSLHVSGDERETETPDGSVGDLSGLHARAAAPVARSSPPPPPVVVPVDDSGEETPDTPERGTSPRQRSPPAAPTPTRARQPGDPGRASHDATWFVSQVLPELSRATEARGGRRSHPTSPPSAGAAPRIPSPGTASLHHHHRGGNNAGAAFPRPSRRRPGTLDARFEAMLSSITREPANPPPIAERSRGREEMDRLTQAVESVSRELAALRALVETSLDVQFETQRAVRQELAGALSDSARAFDRGSDPVTIPGETAGSPDREESRDREGPPDADASSAAVDAAVDAVASLGLGLGLGTAVRRSFPRTEEERRRTDNDRAFHEAARAMDRRNSDPPNAGQCACCMEAAANAVFYRCGHLCCCLRCATKIHRGPERTRNCPVCRAPIVEVIRAYGATEMAGLPRERREEGREVGEGGRGGPGRKEPRAGGAGAAGDAESAESAASAASAAS